MPEKLFLVDGSNQAFRAYHGLQQDLRAPDGFPTRALLGFSRMLLAMRRELKPDYAAIVFDVGLSWRNEVFPAYKGQRPDMPEDLRRQWPELPPLTEEFGFRALALDGTEADDVIGTLARRFASDGVHVRIVSSDKDFCQLVDDRIHVLDVAKGFELGPSEVEAKWGVPPSRIVDLLALMGDSSDNIPGVPGVGEKKAAGFVNQFGSLEEVLANAAAIKGKTGEAVAAHAGDARLARRLVEITTDLPLQEAVPSLDALRPREPDREALAARLLRYNFKTLAADLGLTAARSQSVESSSGVDRSRYRTIQSPDDLAWLVGQLRSAGRFAYDSETTSLDPQQAHVVGMSFCWDPDFGVYVPVAHVSGENCPGALDALLPLLADPSLKKTGQNLKYDLSVLRARGADLCGIDGDTMLADYLLDVDQKHNLDDMALRLLGHRMIAFKDTAGPYGDEFARVPIDQATRYAAEDAHIAWLIDRDLGARLGASETVYRDIELPLIPVLADMELAGIAVDTDAFASLSTELEARVASMVSEVRRVAGKGEDMNVNSTQQLAVILFDERGHEPVKKTKTGRSTDSSVLERLAETSDDPLPRLVLEYRELSKLKSTYVDALPKCVSAVDGRIHTSYHQAVAATGRLSSNDPNLQNIPVRTDEGRRIRRCFVADPGHVFLSADYSQIELRILAHFCGEGPLVEAFRSGEDIHRRTASQIFDVAPAFVTAQMRSAAKAINFGILYGMSAFRLGRELGIPQKKAAAFIEQYFGRYPAVRQFLDGAIQRARETGYATTKWGRRRAIRGLDAKNPMDRGAAERIAMNTPIQGTAADIIKRAMVRVHARIRREFPASRMLLQVHDELVLEVPEADADAVGAAVCDEMRGADDLLVELAVDSGRGRSWDEAH